MNLSCFIIVLKLLKVVCLCLMSLEQYMSKEYKSPAISKMQNIADNLIKKDPSLEKELPKDSGLRKALTDKNPKKKIGGSSGQASAGLGSSGVPGAKMLNSVELQKINLQLEAQLTQEREEKEQLKKEMEIRRERFLKRELEYRAMIEDLENQIK